MKCFHNILPLVCYSWKGQNHKKSKKKKNQVLPGLWEEDRNSCSTECLGQWKSFMWHHNMNTHYTIFKAINCTLGRRSPNINCETCVRMMCHVSYNLYYIIHSYNLIYVALCFGILTLEDSGMRARSIWKLNTFHWIFSVNCSKKESV